MLLWITPFGFQIQDKSHLVSYNGAITNFVKQLPLFVVDGIILLINLMDKY